MPHSYLCSMASPPNLPALALGDGQGETMLHDSPPGPRTHLPPRRIGVTPEQLYHIPCLEGQHWLSRRGWVTMVILHSNHLGTYG